MYYKSHHVHCSGIVAVAVAVVDKKKRKRGRLNSFAAIQVWILIV